MKKIKTVYISSPYSIGDKEENVRDQIVVADRLREFGFVPHVPLLTHFWHLEYPHTGEWWMELHKDYLVHMGFDAVLRLPGESRGADEEVEFAKSVGIPVFKNISALVEWNSYLDYEFR
jgi:hypothetical protein